MFKRCVRCNRKRAFNWRWWLVGLLIALLLLLIAMLLQEQAEFSHVVARYHAETTNHIQTLEQTVNTLQTANNGLKIENAHLAMQIQELKVTINGMELKPANVPAPQISEEPATYDTKTPMHEPFNAVQDAPVIITTLTTLFNGLRLLLPALP